MQASGPTAEDFGGVTLPNGIRFNGWRIETTEGPIASTAALQELRTRLQGKAQTEEKLPKLPEAVFPKNKLELKHEATGQTLSFDAEGALLQWLKNSLVHGSSGLTVPAAALGSWKDKVQEQAQKTGETVRRDWDWTYASDYTGIGADAHGAPLAWGAHAGAGIDMALLRKREPILFFADLPFYSDDLHDNGASESRVRIRVMPSCFFVLLRHWLRIDGTLIRQYDARYFVRFASGRPGGAASNALIRHLRLGSAPLPPLPTAPPDDEGRLVEGGSMDTPRPPFVPPPAVLPDEQVSAERLAALPAESETVEELALAPAPSSAAGAATTTDGVANLSIS